MVNITKLKLTQLQQQLIRFLSINAGVSFNSSRLAKHLKVSPPAMIKALPFLVKEEFIKQKKDESGKKLYELNRDNQKLMLLKRADNLKFIYETDFNSFLEDKFPGATIILFGSYSRGEDTTSSDIDIAVIGRKEKEISLEEYEKVFNRKITLNFYNSLSEVHKDLRENICNGIVLSGGINL